VCGGRSNFNHEESLYGRSRIPLPSPYQLDVVNLNDVSSGKVRIPPHYKDHYLSNVDSFDVVSDFNGVIRPLSDGVLADHYFLDMALCNRLTSKILGTKCMTSSIIDVSKSDSNVVLVSDVLE
jgi:hypothetical protein